MKVAPTYRLMIEGQISKVVAAEDPLPDRDWGQNRPWQMPLITGNSTDFAPVQPNTTTQATVLILQQPAQLPINPHAIQLVQKDRILDQVKHFF